ncbi:hypothetical protein D5R93_04085 [Actinomyces lilanjuaniae]|uniref:DUF8094 domain-containing protein n=1 Tax=Actinomyces lilanjuaniae TaxID=2321394 RepID=A0ABM6Z2F4_9ACTO|nr:hypothetical protein [Actinomyces lilanjuaniae]AYD89444.1 hypothetical protein D5R93_04085 [Actinomyces lilanjuaniae]
MSTSRRALLTGGAASAVALALAACGQDQPAVTPEVTESAVAESVLSAERLTEVLERIKKGMDAADKEKNPDLLSGYVNGPGVRVRQAQYSLATATEDDSQVHVLPATTSQTSSAGVTLDFPRVAINVTDASDDVAPYLMALQQDTARDNFQLWAWVQLFAGAEVPPIASLAGGSEQVVADSDGLVSTPQEVLDSYVGALNDPDGEDGKAWADDALRQKVEADRAIDLGEVGEVSVSASAGSDGFLGLRTDDEGAIVVTTLSYTTTLRRTVDGSEVTLQGPVASMVEDPSVIGTVTATYEAVVAFAIPVEGSDSSPVALGAEAVLAKVERDDDQAPAAQD